MKRVVALVLAMALCGTMFAGCQNKPAASTAPVSSDTPTSSAAVSEPAKPTEITVVTSYGGDDGNRKNYEAAYKAYEKDTGNTVKDASGTSNEEWKSKIMADFETGAEPDVLFYFTGADANKFVQGGKVVSLEEIRKVYPDYANNMREDFLVPSPVDNKVYTVPVNGYWEGLFVNKKVLADAGVKVPGADYTWDQFLKDCETIKAKGYTPIACSLQEVPHYWFEYTIFNHGTVADHLKLPTSSTDEVGKKWVSGLNDIKTLYTKGYFPKNTTTATDAETFQLMADNKAAFAIDGSWKLGWFKDNAKSIDDFTVTYVPGANQRKTTDMVGGISMGYYITKKAWDDPAKQKACVDFVKAMTTDDVVSSFGATAFTALKNGAKAPKETNSLINAALAMTKGATGITAAVQDGLGKNSRTQLFADIKNIVTGKSTAEKTLDTDLAIKG